MRAPVPARPRAQRGHPFAERRRDWRHASSLRVSAANPLRELLAAIVFALPFFLSARLQIDAERVRFVRIQRAGSSINASTDDATENDIPRHSGRATTVHGGSHSRPDRFVAFLLDRDDEVPAAFYDQAARCGTLQSIRQGRFGSWGSVLITNDSLVPLVIVAQPEPRTTTSEMPAAFSSKPCIVCIPSSQL